jgi:hypothetical protein
MNGLTRERQVASRLRAHGYLIGSRRHEPGPGDILAVPLPDVGRRLEPLLVEVKGTARPYERFGPVERMMLAERAVAFGLRPALAWWPAGGVLEWIGPDAWPLTDGIEASEEAPLAGLEVHA